MLWISLCDSLSISSWGNSTSFRGGGDRGGGQGEFKQEALEMLEITEFCVIAVCLQASKQTNNK